MDYIKAIENEQINENLPKFNVGDTVSVHYKILQLEEFLTELELKELSFLILQELRILLLQEKVV